MANAVKPIPEGLHTLTPNLICRNCAKAIEFYKTAFGATEVERHMSNAGYNAGFGLESKTPTSGRAFQSKGPKSALSI